MDTFANPRGVTVAADYCIIQPNPCSPDLELSLLLMAAAATVIIGDSPDEEGGGGGRGVGLSDPDSEQCDPVDFTNHPQLTHLGFPHGRIF